ncbi:hypothetical protein JHK85_004555 [Glycine max]|nr:hypothetical protein JHK85_004555 [Glycine max]
MEGNQLQHSPPWCSHVQLVLVYLVPRGGFSTWSMTSCQGGTGSNRDIDIPKMCLAVDEVVLAFGAESDSSLGIPGENLKAIHSTREFVWWYNGHLDGQNLKPDLKNNGTVVILGQGNVALDIARNLLRPTTELASIDIASHALATLEESSIMFLFALFEAAR